MTNNSQDWRDKAHELIQQGNFDKAYIYGDYAVVMDDVAAEHSEETQPDQQEEE